MSVSVQGKAVYLSGPISGRDAYNRPLFRRVERWLRACGARRVYNPTDMSPKIGEIPKPHEYYMRACLHELTNKRGFDLLVLLPGWETSYGAVVEAHVARALGISLAVVKFGGSK